MIGQHWKSFYSPNELSGESPACAPAESTVAMVGVAGHPEGAQSPPSGLTARPLTILQNGYWHDTAQTPGAHLHLLSGLDDFLKFIVYHLILCMSVSPSCMHKNIFKAISSHISNAAYLLYIGLRNSVSYLACVDRNTEISVSVSLWQQYPQYICKFRCKFQFYEHQSCQDDAF